MRADDPANVPAITDIVCDLPSRSDSPHLRLRPLSAIQRIVVHYDGVAAPCTPAGLPAYDPVERYMAQAMYHINKNWNEGGGPAIRGFGLMYHYRVSVDGKVWRTQSEEWVLWHARAANYGGLAVCCDLGPGQQPPTAQLAGLRSLLDYLCTGRPDIPAGGADVWGHGELQKEGNRTPCPGALLQWVREWRAAKSK